MQEKNKIAKSVIVPIRAVRKEPAVTACYFPYHAERT